MTSKQIKPSKTYFGAFPKHFVIHIHQLLAWGYEDASPRIKTPINSNDKHEPAITGFLAKAIRERIIAFNRPKWCMWYSVHDDPPENVDDKSGKSRPRPDLRIDSNKIGGPQFIFEAKQLPNISEYVGDGGMGCFISGKYASRYDEAGMLGYVQSNSLAHWQQVIKKKIEKEANQLELNPPQEDVHLIADFPLEWVSHHKRNSVGRPISIYHILLDCC